MNGKGLKIFAYLFFIATIVWAVLTFNHINDQWAVILKYCCLGIVGFIILLFVYLLIFCIIDNKRIDKMLDSNQYDQLIDYSIKRKDKKRFLLFDRKYYYEYLLILCYVGKDDDENIVKSYQVFSKMDEFPMTYYWKACYEFSRGNIENIDEYYQSFIRLIGTSRKMKDYGNIVQIFYSLDLYALKEYQKAKENLKKVDVSKISMPSTLKSISIINEELTEA